jgi:hypothetical protein
MEKDPEKMTQAEFEEWRIQEMKKDGIVEDFNHVPQVKKTTIILETVKGDILKYTKEHPPKELTDVMYEAFPGLRVAQYALCRMGDSWWVKFKEKAFPIDDTKGMLYIAHLINSREKIHTKKLLYLVRGENPEAIPDNPIDEKIRNKKTQEQWEKEGLNPAAQHEVLSQKEEERLKDALQKMYDNEDSKFKKVKETYEAFYQMYIVVKKGKILFNPIGREKKKIKTRDLKLHSDYTAVLNAIKAAFRKIKKHDEPLYKHLKSHLKKGEYFKYEHNPENLEWYILF